MPKAFANDSNIFNDWYFVRIKIGEEMQKHEVSDELWLGRKYFL